MVKSIIPRIVEKVPENNRLERIWKLAQNDFKRRYKGSILGLIWALINPLFIMTLFYFVFTFFLDRGQPNFHIHIFSGIIIWLFFGQSTNQSINIFLAKRYLIENIRFNKADLFISQTLSSFFGLLFSVFALTIMSLLAGYHFSLHVLFSVIILFLLYLITLSASMILASLKIHVKDIHQIWDLIVQAGYWTCPVFYSEDVLLEKFRIILYLNPVSILMISFRDVFLRNQFPDWNLLIYAAGFSIVLLFVSYRVLKSNEHLIVEKL